MIPALAVMAALIVPAPAAHTGTNLTGDGLLGVRFGADQQTAITAVSARAGRAPKLTDSANVDCGVDLASWPGLTVDIVDGRLRGYTYSAVGRERLAGLRTGAGLRVGDTSATGHHLYGSALVTSWAQDGSYLIRTPLGRIAGYLKATSKPDTTLTPAGRVVTIGAGDEGCPAASP